MILNTALESLEARCDANYKELRDPTILRDVEQFLLQHNRPSAHYSTNLLKKLVKIVSHGKNEHLIAHAGATYGAPTLTIALTYCHEGIERLDHDPRDSIQRKRDQSHFHSFAGNFHTRLSKKIPDTPAKIAHLDQAHKHYSDSIATGEQAGDTYPVAFTYAFRASVAEELAAIHHATEKINWHFLAAQDMAESAKRTERYAPKHALFQYSFASRNLFKAAALARKTPGRQIHLLRDAIFYAQESFRVTAAPNTPFAKSIQYDIGKYADMLWTIEHRTLDAEQAIAHYTLVIDYFAENPDQKHANITEIARQRRELLKRVI